MCRTKVNERFILFIKHSALLKHHRVFHIFLIRLIEVCECIVSAWAGFPLQKKAGKEEYVTAFVRKKRKIIHESNFD